jgi:hypothetical protein
MTEQATALIRYDAMVRAIDAAYKVDEVKDIRDRALALELYSRLAHNVDNESRACQIRLRAERKAGQLSKQLARSKGGAPGTTKGSDATLATTARVATKADQLEAAGITPKQARQWEKLADVPDEQFEAALARPGVPTTNGVIASAVTKKVNPVSNKALWVHGTMRDLRCKSDIR